jgi:crotonobetainyl-CoA:carnitine CoA-transferase CaiB-like acyl-CoA transferase
LETALATIDGEALAIRLLDAGVPAGPVMEVSDVIAHPHTLHREMIVEMAGYRGTGNPVKLSRTPATLRSTPPRFGSATRRVLVAAGYSEAEIDALIAAGIALTEPRPAKAD